MIEHRIVTIAPSCHLCRVIAIVPLRHCTITSSCHCTIVIALSLPHHCHQSIAPSLNHHRTITSSSHYRHKWCNDAIVNYMAVSGFHIFVHYRYLLLDLWKIKKSCEVISPSDHLDWCIGIPTVYEYSKCSLIA